MALTLVTGGAGSGKTESIYQHIIDWSIREPERQFFVIVPEQATMQAQKDIVRLHPRHGTMNIDIVSFGRLAYRIFSELAMPQPEVLDDIGKTMVLRKLAGENRKDLAMFSSHLNQAGFIDEVKSMLSEFYQYGVTPERLAEQCAKDDVSRILERKLEDMRVIYEAFRAFTKEKYITMEELLDVLCGVIGRSALMKHSVLALDGFTGFTPVQYRLLGLLLRICDEVYVTVTATEGALGEPDNEADLFDMSRTMANKMKRLAEENGVEIRPDWELRTRPLPRFANRTCLDYLERTMFRYPYRPYAGVPEGIRLVQAENPTDEVDFVVNRIHQLVKKQGYRYREIAVVTGDLAGYAREIARQFEAGGIPYFVDEKRDVSGNPFVRLMKSILEIQQRGFDYESMFQYLRTGLVTDEVERIDRLETYVRAMGIRGFARWSEPWERTYEGGGRLNLVELNAFRETILAPLAKFREATETRGNSVKVLTKALTELLLDLDVQRKLLEKSKAFRAMGLEKEAREYEEIFDLVMDLFDRLCDLLGEESVSKKEYLEILKAGFQELKVGMIPAGADRVVAGDLKRTRLAGIRALFFIGVNEGIVPADAGKGGILTEQEREILKKNALELAPTTREEGFMQRFYLYLAMTKPSDLLTMSWTGRSSEGKAMRPSSLIGQMRKRFPDLPVCAAEQEKEAAISEQAAGKSVIAWMQDPDRMQDDAEAMALYRYLAGAGGQSVSMEQLADACTYAYKEKGIGREAAKELYGRILSSSVTRMEGYAGCAYAHFLSHGLELKKRREYELDFSDMGNLFHRSIDLFFKEAREQGKDFRTISDRERRAMVRSVVERVSLEYRNTIMKSSARNSYLEKKVEKITDRTIRALIYQIQKGDFTPDEFEIDVSTKVALKGGETLNLRGRIDRLDVFEDEDRVYVKIMDYKSGSTSFDLALLYHGLQLQLVVYMDAALQLEKKKHPGKQAVPAGIFYYHIDDPVLERPDDDSPEAVEAGILRKLRMNGLVNSSLDVIKHLDREIQKESDVIPVALKDGLVQEYKSSVAGGDRFEHLSEFVGRSLRTMGEEIMDGNTAINPYKQGTRTACDYCPYHSICGFDLKTPGYGYRKFRPMKAEQIWAKIEEGNEEESVTEDAQEPEGFAHEDPAIGGPEETPEQPDHTTNREPEHAKSEEMRTKGGADHGEHDVDEGTTAGH